MISAPIYLEALAGTEYRYQVVAVDPDWDDQVTVLAGPGHDPPGKSAQRPDRLAHASGRPEHTRAGHRWMRRIRGAASSPSQLLLLLWDPSRELSSATPTAHGGGENGAPDWIVYADPERETAAAMPTNRCAATLRLQAGKIAGRPAGAKTAFGSGLAAGVQTAPANPAGVTMAPGLPLESHGARFRRRSSETTPTARPCSPLRRLPRPPWRTRWHYTAAADDPATTTRWIIRSPTAPQAWPSIAGRAAPSGRPASLRRGSSTPPSAFTTAAAGSRSNR